MSTITRIEARAIADSRGRPTLSVSVHAGASQGTFLVPSGASTGSREAHELHDDDGGVSHAVALVNGELNDALRGTRVTDQRALDELLISFDGTSTKSRIGSNSAIGISLAASRAAASLKGVELFEYLRSLATLSPSRVVPHLFVNLINGGKHAPNGSPLQEHHIITESENPGIALAQAQRIESALATVLENHGIVTHAGDEGGVAYPVAAIEDPFRHLQEALKVSGIPGIAIGADAAASSFFDGMYTVLGRRVSATELAERYVALHAQYGLTYLEDPFEENDSTAFASLKSRSPGLTLIGDDLTTTNPASIRVAAERNAIQAVIIKPNQIGTLSETLDAMKEARARGIHCIVSHRSGETMDSYIADLAFAFGAYGLKAGAPSAPERKVKYERLVEIAHDAEHP